MKTKIKYSSGDRVKLNSFYQFYDVISYLQDGVYVMYDKLTNSRSIHTEDDVKLIRTYDDPKIIYDEMVILGYEITEKFEDCFESRLDYYDEIVRRNYSNYNKTLHYEVKDNIVVIYILLNDKKHYEEEN